MSLIHKAGMGAAAGVLMVCLSPAWGQATSPAPPDSGREYIPAVNASASAPAPPPAAENPSEYKPANKAAPAVQASAPEAAASVAPAAPASSKPPDQAPSSSPVTASASQATGQPAAPVPPISSVAKEKLEHLPAKYDVSRIGNRDIGGGMNFYSMEREAALGKQLANQVEQTSRLVTDPVVTEYVNRVGQNIVRNSDARVPFVIKVIDDDTVNAFALPGGFFYVDSGLILAADNEAELAGVMAHEIAHVAARHATKQATKSQLFDWASLPLIFIGGPSGYAIRSIAALAVPLGYLKFSRGAEREADLLGLEYLYASGYDPEAFVQFFEKLEAREKQHHGFLAKTFSTHPMNAERVKSAQKEIAQYLPDRPQYILTTSEFDEVKARLMVLTSAGRISSQDGEVRPTLRRREGSDKVDGDGGSEEGRPTLKRAPDAGGSSAPQTTTSSDDDGRPTLKRSPQP